MLLDLKNIGEAVGFLFLSRIATRYFICTSGARPPSLISQWPRQTRTINPVVLLDIENIGISVGIVLLSCVQAEIYVISTSGSRPLHLIFHTRWRRPLLSFIPLCCSMQNICVFLWKVTYIISAMSGLSVSGFTSAILISSWTRIELCTGRCCYKQRGLWHLQKQTQRRWICFQKWFTPCDSMVTKFMTFSPKHHPQRLYFRWRNSIKYWTFSKISTSFHHALMALGIRRCAMEDSDWQRRYSRKTRGCSFCTPHCLRVNTLMRSTHYFKVSILCSLA